MSLFPIVHLIHSLEPVATVVTLARLAHKAIRESVDIPDSAGRSGPKESQGSRVLVGIRPRGILVIRGHLDTVDILASAALVGFLVLVDSRADRDIQGFRGSQPIRAIRALAEPADSLATRVIQGSQVIRASAGSVVQPEPRGSAGSQAHWASQATQDLAASQVPGPQATAAYRETQASQVTVVSVAQVATVGTQGYQDTLDSVVVALADTAASVVSERQDSQATPVCPAPASCSAARGTLAQFMPSMMSSPLAGMRGFRFRPSISATHQSKGRSGPCSWQALADIRATAGSQGRPVRKAHQDSRVIQASAAIAVIVAPRVILGTLARLAILDSADSQARVDSPGFQVTGLRAIRGSAVRSVQMASRATLDIQDKTARLGQMVQADIQDSVANQASADSLESQAIAVSVVIVDIQAHPDIQASAVLRDIPDLADHQAIQAILVSMAHRASAGLAGLAQVATAGSVVRIPVRVDIQGSLVR